MKKFLFISILLISATFNRAQTDIDLNPISVTELAINATDNEKVESLNVNSSDSIEINENIFKNLKANAKPEGLELTWSLDYEAFSQLSEKQIVIKYNTKIGSKRNKEGYAESDWKYTKPIDIKETSFEIKDLQGAEKYEVYIGIVDKSEGNQITKDSEVGASLTGSI